MKSTSTFSSSASDTVGRIADSAHDVVDEATAKLESATDAITSRAALLQEKQRHAVAVCREGIRSNPLIAVGAAVAVGWIVARLTRHT